MNKERRTCTKLDINTTFVLNQKIFLKKWTFFTKLEKITNRTFVLNQKMLNYRVK